MGARTELRWSTSDCYHAGVIPLCGLARRPAIALTPSNNRSVEGFMRSLDSRAVRRVIHGLCVGVLTFGGCGDSSTGPGGGDGIPTARFIDSPVEGLEYTVGALGGTTDNTGRFEYVLGADVTFKVGGIVLGTAPVARVLTPIDLVPGAFDVFDSHVTNIARFLQTIDDDAIPTNGLTITEAVRTAAAGRSIDFDQAVINFENDVDVQNAIAALTAATAAGPRTLLDVTAAQANLTSAIEELLPGNYSGIFELLGSGNNLPQIGTWSFSIDTQGVVTGSGTVQGQPVDFAGTVGTGGSIADSQGPGSETAYDGTITPSGEVSGHWYGPGDIIAHFEGQRN